MTHGLYTKKKKQRTIHPKSFININQSIVMNIVSMTVKSMDRISNKFSILDFPLLLSDLCVKSEFVQFYQLWFYFVGYLGVVDEII